MIKGRLLFIISSIFPSCSRLLYSIYSLTQLPYIFTSLLVSPTYIYVYSNFIIIVIMAYTSFSILRSLLFVMLCFLPLFSFCVILSRILEFSMIPTSQYEHNEKIPYFIYRRYLRLRSPPIKCDVEKMRWRNFNNVPILLMFGLLFRKFVFRMRV